MASAGRTMLAVELCRTLAGDGRRPPDGSIGSIDALAPPAIARAVAHQLAGHGPAATALAQAIALLGADARLRVAAALAGLALEDAARVGDRLRSACLLAPAAPLAFVAPVVRNVVYESIPLGQRALLHAAAARLLVVSGASEEAITEHLMRSEPADDPAAVELLRRAASEATARGDPRRAALLLERALAEPPPPAERSAVVLELGVAESRVVMPGAPGHLAQALRAGTPAERAEAALELAEQHLLSARYGEAAALLESELEELPLRGADVVLRLRAELTACRLVSAGPRSPSRWGDGTDELSGATQGERALLAVAACGGALAGEPRELTLPLAQRALEGRGAGVSGGISSIAVAMLLVQAAQSAEAPALGQRALEQALAAAGASGSAIGEIALLAVRSRCRLVTGALGEAEADARRALEHGRRLGLELLASLALASLLESLLDQGRIADAERELAAGGADAHVADDLPHCLLLIARGRLRAAAGEAHLGLRDLLAAGARLLRSDCGTPSFDWRSRAGLLSHRLDRREQALRLIDDELALAQRLGAPRPLGVALRARALIAPPPDQIELLGAAVQLLRATPAKLDCARALCDLGAATRRSGSRNQAREPLQEALQLAHECGAVALAGRARHELIVLGARPRRHAVTGVEALTARERQASELAAEGLTNRQIAATMTVTPNTVEYHLTNAYRKLGIATRDELRAGLGGVRPGADQLARARA